MAPGTFQYWQCPVGILDWEKGIWGWRAAARGTSAASAALKVRNAGGEDAVMAAATFLGTGIQLEPNVPCSGTCKSIDKNLGKSTRCRVPAAREGAGIARSDLQSRNGELRQGEVERGERVRNAGPRRCQRSRGQADWQDGPGTLQAEAVSVRGSSPEQGCRQRCVSTVPVRIASPSPGAVLGRWVLGGTAQSPFV